MNRPFADLTAHRRGPTHVSVCLGAALLAVTVVPMARLSGGSVEQNPPATPSRDAASPASMGAEQAPQPSEVTRQQRSVLCVVPRGQFKPQSESELLAELNSHLPFTITQKDFISKRRSTGMVGWVIVENDPKKEAVKTKLKPSATLRLLQVEGLTPEFEALIQQHRLSRDLNSMIRLLESGAWNEMADQFVIPSRAAEAKEGLKLEMNRQITLAIFKELATKKATFSKDGQSATFRITGDDIPREWRFENAGDRWRFADRL